jgi:hypothetical protein
MTDNFATAASPVDNEVAMSGLADRLAAMAPPPASASFAS